MTKRMKHKGKVMFGGLSAEEFHSAHAFPADAKCMGCNQRKGIVTRIITLAPLDEVKKRDPLFETLAETSPQGLMKVLVATKHGPYVRMATIYACKRCTPAAERAAAKGPSWVIVDINRGPGSDRAVA